MILTTFLCFAFIIIQAVPIKADTSSLLLGNTDYFTISCFKALGYNLSQFVSANAPSSIDFSWSYHEPIDTPGGTLAGTGSADGTISNSPSITKFVFPSMGLQSGSSSSAVFNGEFRAGNTYDYIPDSFPHLSGMDNFFVISYIGSGFGMTVSSGFTLAGMYQNQVGSEYLFTYVVYPSDRTSGNKQFVLNMANRPSTIYPIYMGMLSQMPEDLKICCGLSGYSAGLSDSISSSNLENISDKIDLAVNYLALINNRVASIDTNTSSILSSVSNIEYLLTLAVRGNDASVSASSDLTNKSDLADSSISGLEGKESDLIGDFNSNLIQPDTSFITQLSTTGNWVRTQFDRLVGLNGAFSGALVVGLTVALALVIIGKMRG